MAMPTDRANISDTHRLDWMLQNGCPEIDNNRERTEFWCIFWRGASNATNWVAGKYIARGTSARECIDQAILGNIGRIDD